MNDCECIGSVVAIAVVVVAIVVVVVVMDGVIAALQFQTDRKSLECLRLTNILDYLLAMEFKLKLGRMNLVCALFCVSADFFSLFIFSFLHTSHFHCNTGAFVVCLFSLWHNNRAERISDMNIFPYGSAK